MLSFLIIFIDIILEQ